MGIGTSIGYAQQQFITQKDIDLFLQIQPALNSIAETMAKQKKPMSDSKEGCQGGCDAYSPAYRKELERLLKGYPMSVEQFHDISKRILTLYSLISTDDIAAGMMQTAKEGKNLLDPVLLASLRSAAEEQEKEQSSALSQYSESEKALIRKNLPKLDELFTLTPVNIVE